MQTHTHIKSTVSVFSLSVTWSVRQLAIGWCCSSQQNDVDYGFGALPLGNGKDFTAKVTLLRLAAYTDSTGRRTLIVLGGVH